ncbi:unnamed protein product [Taenia asiatica]|uniref:Uncharacterized protein n=1 Tax=Taenia asiatica TaxID=60517 RepID=A0A0R3VZR4_TAEAS|nr:unnamed protein product [Taenia asiatica]
MRPFFVRAKHTNVSSNAESTADGVLSRNPNDPLPPLPSTMPRPQWANEEGEEAHGYDVSEGTYYDTVADPPTFSCNGDLVGREEISEFEGTYYNHNQHPNSDMENDDMEEGGGRSRRLSFFTYKSSCMEDSMLEATLSDVEASAEAVFIAMLPPLPVTLEERWRRMMSAYQTQVGEEAEEEHLYDEVASNDCGMWVDKTW